MTKDRVASERFDHGDNSVVTTNVQVVALGNVMGKHYAASLTEAAECGEENWSLKVLRFIDDDKSVGEAPSADVCERKNFKEFTVDDFVDDFRSGNCFKPIEYGRSPWTHLFEFGTREIPEVLAADGVERAEDHDAFMAALFKY
jgi:hypothetical protein